MQEETKTPYYAAAQEPNDAPDPWGVAANLEGFEVFDQDPSGEESVDEVASRRLSTGSVGVAAGAEEADSLAPPGPDPEANSPLVDWADSFAPDGLAVGSEDPAASADLGDPTLYDTGVGDPWGTPLPGTVEQEQGHTFNPLFNASWEDPGVPSPGTAEQEGEPIFAPPWEDLNAQPSGMVEQEQVPAFAAPWEDDSAAPDPETGVFTAGWDSVPDTTPEGQEDVSSAGFEQILKSFDVWSEPNGMAEGATDVGDIWQDTSEGLIEDVGGAFEGVGEATEDVFGDDIF